MPDSQPYGDLKSFLKLNLIQFFENISKIIYWLERDLAEEAGVWVADHR
jgi:hypothetical protein